MKIKNLSSQIDEFVHDSNRRCSTYFKNEQFKTFSATFMQSLIDKQYAYNFLWAGVPIIQIPQELQAMHEIIWQVKPTCIIETGVAWGGSVLHSASHLILLEHCKAIESGLVIGVDIEIRPHNRDTLKNHPLCKNVHLIEGSSIDPKVFDQVKSLASDHRVLVILDSNHTHDHVLQELELYSTLVAEGSYIIVGDTGIENFQNAQHAIRPWGHGNSPLSAVRHFLASNPQYEIDSHIEEKLILTGSPSGYLRRIIAD